MGFTLVKTAAFNLDHCSFPNKDDPLCPCHENAVHVWTNSTEAEFHSAPTVDEKWQVTNRYLIQVLTANGAKWEESPKQRGCAPSFRPTRICPGQSAKGDALSRKTKRIAVIVNLLRGIYLRLTRPIRSFADGETLTRSIRKARLTLFKWNCPCVWPPNQLPTLVYISDCLQWLEGVHTSVTRGIRHARIQTWKEKLRASAEGTKKFVFQHLKNKSCEEPPNLITDTEGNILYQPLDALAEFNSQWDQVFGANALHEDPHTILKVIWPYVSHVSSQPDIPDISARDLCEQIHRRNPNAAPGLDGFPGSHLYLWHFCSTRLRRNLHLFPKS